MSATIGRVRLLLGGVFEGIFFEKFENILTNRVKGAYNQIGEKEH